MRQVVVGVGHIDESLDEVGALDQAQEHLWTRFNHNSITHQYPTQHIELRNGNVHLKYPQTGLYNQYLAVFL